jgi:excinuclease ABC subunit A
MTVDQVNQLFKKDSKIGPRLEVLRRVGLGYLVWKQPIYTLSGGEVQRLKIAKELIKKTTPNTLYIFDEPTVGLHLQDVFRLVEVINHLVSAGHTVIAIEHHLHLLAACDWLIELGPAGGPGGGRVIATGRPEDVACCQTPTAPYLQALLERTS